MSIFSSIRVDAAPSFPAQFPLVVLVAAVVAVGLPLFLVDRARGKRPQQEPPPGERVRWFLRTAAKRLLWPAASAVAASIAYIAVGRGSWPEGARDGLGVLWFLGLFLVIDTGLHAFLPPGSGRRRWRKVAVPFALACAALSYLNLLGPVLAWLDRPLVPTGDAAMSPLSIVVAILIALGFLLASRGLGDLVGNGILPSLGFDRALSDALGAVCRYLLVIIGVLVAADHLGFNTTNLKIVLGALSVGIGFGLQNIVNNFVSGIILMFERTVKRGAVIELDGVTGRVLSVGLRSSIVRTRAGHEIIVPNGDLIAARVDNLNFQDPRLRLDVPVGVSYASDPEEVRAVLLGVAAAHPDVLASPEPDVMFRAYGESSLDFELRVWVNDPWTTPKTKSELLYAAWTALKEAGVEIPFPQRDLHIRSGGLAIDGSVHEEE